MPNAGLEHTNEEIEGTNYIYRQFGDSEHEIYENWYVSGNIDGGSNMGFQNQDEFHFRPSYALSADLFEKIDATHYRIDDSVSLDELSSVLLPDDEFFHENPLYGTPDEFEIALDGPGMVAEMSISYSGGEEAILRFDFDSAMPVDQGIFEEMWGV